MFLKLLYNTLLNSPPVMGNNMFPNRGNVILTLLANGAGF